jgi:hypothetical protein
MQGPLLLAEAGLARLCRQAGLRLPRAVCVANTVAVLHLRESFGGCPGRYLPYRAWCGLVSTHFLPSPPLPLLLGADLPAVAQALFFPDIVEAGLPRRLLHQLLPGGICQAPAA